MPILDSASIRPLRLAENHFLEVLLSKFNLRREGSGAHLEVSFDSETPACWNRAGRDEIYAHLSKQGQKITNYQTLLENVLVHGSAEGFPFDDPDFVFRWASAGALPIVRLGDEEYYCLFYREIRPIGWNIANGACDSSTELLDPLCTLERELCEELIILDPKTSSWYGFDRGDASFLHRPEHRTVQLIVETLKKKGLWQRNAGVGLLETGLQWFNGPDSATIYAQDILLKTEKHDVAGCFLNINAEDFGIELDRVVKINVGKDALVFDGEVSNGRLLNRVVGLFRTDRFDLEKNEYIPDKCFYGGDSVGGPAFQHRMGNDFLKDIKLSGLRSRAEIEAYEAEKFKFDLCPVTRQLLQRFMSTLPKQPAATAACEVFISFGHGDEKLADKVARFIEKRCGKNVFYYPDKQKDYDFSRAIDEALESAECIVVVGSRLENLMTRWPEYEYRTFNIDVNSGKKPKGKLLSLVVGIDPISLPLPLRRFAVTSCASEIELPNALEQLVRYIG